MITAVAEGAAGIILWIRLGIEIISGLLVVGGVIASVGMLLQARLTPGKAYELARYRLSRFLVVALEFQLASDILGTALEPGWEQLGKLGAIAVIRTFLNYFLTREVAKMEREKVVEESALSP